MMQTMVQATSDDAARMNALAPQSQHNVPNLIKTAGTLELGRSDVIETYETAEQVWLTPSQDNSLPAITPRQEPWGLPEVCIGCYGGIEEQGTIIRTCPSYNGNHLYHAECTKSFFLAACKDGSLMPPSCCGPINLSTGLSVLSTLERELFMPKYEEWSTTDRINCPVLSCSACIPKRMIPSLRIDSTGA